MDEYKYEPLPSHEYIRIAHIHPATFNDDLVVDLTIVDFRESWPAYEALSYVWGSEDKPDFIVVNGEEKRRLAIGQELSAALKALRLRVRPRVVWVDALCIDQANNEEKGPQVAMMGAIFQHASRVVAWLGPQREGSKEALAFMERLGTLVDYNLVTRQLKLLVATSTQTLIDNNLNIRINDRLLHCIYLLVSRPWFERLWIRQEIFLSSSQSLMLCGRDSAGWPAFRKALICLRKGRTLGCEDYVMNRELRERLEKIKSFIYQEQSVSLRDLRSNFGDAKCQNPRDRLYAILYLLHAEERKMIAPDYTKTAPHAFRDAVLSHITHFRLLDILCECEYSDEWKAPSWVPDWTVGSRYRRRVNEHIASAQISGWFDTDRAEDGILRVSGVAVSEIEELRAFPDERLWNISDIFLLFHHVFEGMDMHEAYADGGSLLGAVTDSVVSNKWEDTYEPPRTTLVKRDTGLEVIKLTASRDSRYNIGGVPRFRHFLVDAQLRCLRRQFFRGSGGYIGLAPSNARKGDKVCAVVGCETPLLLRKQDQFGYKVIGSCFMAGAMYGEAFLGPVPEHTQPVYCSDAGAWGFRDKMTGEISFEDPRLSSLPIDLTEYRRELKIDNTARIHIDLEVLRERQPRLGYFDLV